MSEAIRASRRAHPAPLETVPARPDYRAANEPVDDVGLPDRPDATPGPVVVDRWGVLWNRKWVILLAALLAAAAALGVTSVVPKTFSSSVRVDMVASPVLGASTVDLTNAGNNLAAQAAQLVDSQVVLQPAAEATGTTADALRSRTTAGTVASQNIVLITVQASTAALAQERGTAIATSLVDYLQAQGKARSKSYSDTISNQISPLDDQIEAAGKEVTAARKALAAAGGSDSGQELAAASSRLNSAQSLVTVLTDRRAAILAQTAQQATSLVPRTQILGDATAAEQVEPRPALYAGVAGLLALAVAAQVSVLLAERQARTGRASRRASRAARSV